MKDVLVKVLKDSLITLSSRCRGFLLAITKLEVTVCSQRILDHNSSRKSRDVNTSKCKLTAIRC